MPGRPWHLHPSSARFVTSPRIGYASRPNRAIDGRGLSPPRSAALLAAPTSFSLVATRSSWCDQWPDTRQIKAREAHSANHLVQLLHTPALEHLFSAVLAADRFPGSTASRQCVSEFLIRCRPAKRVLKPMAK